MKKGLILNFSPNRSGSSSLISKQIYRCLKNLSQVKLVNINDLTIHPCGNCTKYCYRYGKCKINDDMQVLYNHFENDNFIIFVTPVYFYHIPGYAKIMIDRCQPYWVKKYVLKNYAPQYKYGSVVCIAATKGKKLFSGINLTLKYFFDIFNIVFDKKNSLYLREVETRQQVDIFEIDKYIKKLKTKISEIKFC